MVLTGPYLGYMEPGTLEGCGESLGASKLEVWELASFHHFLERLGEAFKTTIGDKYCDASQGEAEPRGGPNIE